MMKILFSTSHEDYFSILLLRLRLLVPRVILFRLQFISVLSNSKLENTSFGSSVLIHIIE